MARHRVNTTKYEIIRTATELFLERGYSTTTPKMICDALDISTGNLTYYFPTKEHLLAELVDMLCKYQWKLMEEEAKDGYSSVMALCLELLTIASACEQDQVAKDFFLSTYRSDLCMELIRRNDRERAQKVFEKYCPDWTEEFFSEAEALVSGIEYATLLTTANSAPLEIRVAGALGTILSLYNVPKEIRDKNIKKVLAMNYRALGLQTLKNFREFVKKTNEQTFEALLSGAEHK